MGDRFGLLPARQLRRACQRAPLRPGTRPVSPRRRDIGTRRWRGRFHGRVVLGSGSLGRGFLTRGLWSAGFFGSGFLVGGRDLSVGNWSLDSLRRRDVCGRVQSAPIRVILSGPLRRCRNAIRWGWNWLDRIWGRCRPNRARVRNRLNRSRGSRLRHHIDAAIARSRSLHLNRAAAVGRKLRRGVVVDGRHPRHGMGQAEQQTATEHHDHDDDDHAARERGARNAVQGRVRYPGTDGVVR